MVIIKGVKMTIQELCFALINSRSEEDITNIIKSNEILNDDRNWAPYGELENNVGTFLSQQSSPVDALTEKIINSVDAVLLAECRKRGIDPEGAKAPRSMQEAVEQFFGIKDGDYTEVARKRRREIAENIMVIAEGDKKKPCIVIVDKGEGQNPKDFETTFLSLHKRNKIRIQFVQGKFNMGGTGALPFCGKSHYQLILSRRHPDFLSPSQRDFWGFTLVRYNGGSGFDRSGIFQYCTDRGDILKFEGHVLNILPDNKIFEYGTFIKLYDYRLNKPSSVLRDLYKDLNRSLYDSAIPFLIYENRDFNITHGKDTPVLGNKWRIRIDDRELVEEFLTIDAVLGEFGLCRIEVIVLKEDAPKENFTTINEAVFFTINGQKHSALGRSFLRSSGKAGLDYLADSLAVFIELSNISTTVRDHAFMGSRDRMRDDEIKKGVEEDLAEVLRNHKGLKKINLARREKAISSNPKDEEFIKKVLEKLVKSNDTIADILGVGVDIPHVTRGENVEENYVGKRFPTFLKIYKYGSDKKLCKDIPINSFGIIKLETDVENNYLNREVDSGELIVSPISIRKSSYLYNGIITLKLIPNKNWKVNEIHHCEVILTRPYDDPLKVEFDIRIVNEVKPGNNPATDDKPSKLRGLNIPRPNLVYKDKSEDPNRKIWEEMNPIWDGRDIAEVRTIIIDKDKKYYDVYINMDSDDLHSFLIRKKLSHAEQDSVKRLYQTSILLYSLVLYNDLIKKNGGAEELLPTLMKSISKICLDLAYSEALIKSID
jgi:hypothetical protein